jgi:ABC-type multidrug transport system permease subunit
MLQNVAVYPAERDTFYREYDDSCYGAFTFLSSYTLLVTPFTVVSSLMFGLLAAYAVNLRETGFMFIVASYNIFCVISCGESLGMIFCTFFSSHVGLAMHTSSALFSFASTMAGIVALNIPRALQIMNYLSPFKYFVINLAVYSLKGREFTCTSAEEVRGECPISTGEQVLELYNIDGDPRLSLLILGVLAVFYRLVAYTVIKGSRIERRLEFSRLPFMRRGKRGAQDIV